MGHGQQIFTTQHGCCHDGDVATAEAKCAQSNGKRKQNFTPMHSTYWSFTTIKTGEDKTESNQG